MNSNAGYAGLFRGADLTQQSKDNLVVAEQLSNFTDKKRKEQEEDQAKVAAMQEEIRKQTDQLLGYDKKKLNEAKRGAFNIIRNQIVANGGDYSRFMANGGRAILDNYKNSILNSDAMISYQENQKNMSTILELEKKGMGHLINPVDRANMESYRRNKGGKITYTGQLMDVKLPDGKDYDWNTNAPVEDILTYDGNRTKIMNNYAMSFPHLKQPPSETDLLTYVKSMYSVRGTDWQRGANERDFNAREDQRSIDNNYRDNEFGWRVSTDARYFNENKRRYDTDRSDKLDERESSLLLQLAKANGMNPDGTASNGQGSQTPDESFVTNVGFLNDSVDNRNISVSDWQKSIWDKVDRPASQGGFAEQASEMQYSKFNLKSNMYDASIFASDMAPKNARFITNLDSQAAAIAAVNKKYVIEGNTIKGVITKDENWFGSDGQVLSENAGFFYNRQRGKKERDFKIKGVASVATYKDGQGKKNILMESYNTIGGGVDKDYDKKINSRVKQTNVKMEQMVVAQDPNSGELIYIPFNTNDAPTRTRYATNTKSDNLKPQRSTYKNQVQTKNNLEKKTQQQEQVNKETFQSFINDNASNSVIRNKSSILGVPNKPGSRIPLMTSYYATLAAMGGDPTLYSAAVQGDSFEQMLREANAYGSMKGTMSDQQLIRTIQRAQKDGSQSQFFENWIKNYQNLNNM